MTPCKRKTLYVAIDTLHEQWGRRQMATAYTNLDATVARAEQALSVLEPQQDKREIAFQIHVLGLAAMVMVAREELQRAERFALDTVGQRRAREEASRNVLDAKFPAGTILSCPTCGEGLYKTTTQVTTKDLVLDDGTLLVPLNRTIPSRDAWAPLACPLCGGRLLKDGQMHTLQHGWV